MLADLRVFHREIRERGLAARLREIRQPSLAWAASAIALDFGVILLGWALSAFVSWYLIPITLLIIGSRQRALGNLLHDASHGSLDVGRRNDRWAVFCVGPAMFNVLAIYRHAHTTHHNYLGSPAHDPDFIHRPEFHGMGWWRILSHCVFAPEIWRGSFLGHLRPASWRERAWIALWWIGALGLLALAFGGAKTASFALCWLAARATTFHVITTFREINDHVGLTPGGLIAFSRNAPTRGWARMLLHPHNNGYHLAHHLDPRIPFHALPRAYALFRDMPSCRRAHHCDSYFWGKHAIVDCWRGHCPDGYAGQSAGS